MATSFFKEERVAFTNMVKAFEDQLAYGQAATLFDELTPAEMVYTRDRVWVDTPMIGSSYDGFDQTSNFDGLTELVVPASVGFHKASPKVLSSKNLRNERAMTRWMDSAKAKLASDVNAAVRRRVALEAAIFTKRTVAPTGFDDLAVSQAQMDEIGVPVDDRVAFIGTRAAIGMASNLASRQTMNGVNLSAYEKTKLIDIANYEVYRDDQPIRLAAAAGGATTVNGANQYWEPAAFTTEPDGEQVNRDNRYSQLVVAAASIASVKQGDAFTIAGVNAMHRISKQDTGQLQTFRVIAVNTSTNTLTIAPAIISNGGATIAGREYQNVTATPANGATITWLNTTTAEINPFFSRRSVLLLPGSFKVDAGDGWAVMKATTPVLGLPITYTRQGNINDLSLKARVDIDFGTALLAPDQAGVVLFNQA
ncbi:P22 phage major capsid protein family protein [Sphingomonas albertensis]|uniref:P22 phage major capsid protein family protein n=1 Tax=Sphingomonas albertensis TaxID=2762591 RepID=UPI0037D99BF9